MAKPVDTDDNSGRVPATLVVFEAATVHLFGHPVADM
jgi:hypothetical protein